MIATAYFFPGWRLLRDLRRASRRGVQVDLILQGNPDMPWVQTMASLLYRHLARAGVCIHEYTERPLHGKVAVVDDAWATVGSSNLDPLSLGLNLEANVVLRDRAFARQLREHLDGLMTKHCSFVHPGNARAAAIGVDHGQQRGGLPLRPQVSGLGPDAAGAAAADHAAARRRRGHRVSPRALPHGHPPAAWCCGEQGVEAGPAVARRALAAGRGGGWRWWRARPCRSTGRRCCRR